MHSRASGLYIGLWVLAAISTAHAQPAELRTALIEYGEFSDQDLKTIERKPVVKEVAVDDKRREAAVLAAVP